MGQRLTVIDRIAEMRSTSRTCTAETLWTTKSCFLRRVTVAIAINRTGTGIPKFTDILGGITENAVMLKNGITWLRLSGDNHDGLA